MDDLVTWLGEQLDEDERIARATHSSFLAWEYDVCVKEIRDLGNGNELVHGVLPRYGEFIAEHDPARVLREIDAKRELLTLHAAVADHGRFSDHGECEKYGCDGDHRRPPVCRSCRTYAGDPEEAPCSTLRILAMPYADREGYRAEWAPSE
ncbi:DUF6221 family protein [Streptomyces sp. NPDC002285]